MAVSDHMKPGLTDKSRVKILTVDPANRRIEAAIKDGSMIHIAVWDVPSAFRWPIVGETWIVRRDTGIWMLDHRVQTGQVVGSGTSIEIQPEAVPLEGMAPGQMKLDGEIVVDATGKTFVAVDLTGIANGWTLRWNSTLKRFVAGP